MSNDYPPYRESCQNAPVPQCGLGPLYKHGKASESGIPKYINSTLVPNWNTDVGGTIAPFERWTQDFSGDGSCEVHHCVDGGAPCAQWPRPFSENTFSHTAGDTVDLKICRKQGFKNVQAARFWSGSNGYMHSTGPDTIQACDSGTSLKRWLSYQATAPTTKYLNVAISAEYKQSQFTYDGDTPTEQVNIDDSVSFAESIDPTSGLLSLSGLAIDRNDDRNFALTQISKALWTREDIVNRMTTPIQSPAGTGTTTFTDTGYTVTTEFVTTGGPIVIEDATWDLAGGSFSRKLYTIVGDNTQVQNGQEDVTLTDSTFVYAEWDSTIGGGSDGTLPTAQEWITVNGTFSGSNTSASLLADIKDNLLSLWPMDDDSLYPWRTDLKVSIAPLVTRDELWTPAFTTNVYVKDYGTPIANDTGSFVGATIGDVNWSGHCGVVLSPDPNTGVMVQAFSVNVTSGDTVSIPVPGFSYTADISSYTTIGGTLPPGVSFNSTTGVIEGTATADGNYGITIQSNAAIAAATGAIIGAPNPAGYQDYFQFGFIDMRGCCLRPGDGSQNWDWYQLGWGQWLSTFNSNTSCSLPLNATQWNNWFQSINKPPGAWIFYADKGDYFGSGCVSSTGHSGAGDAGMVVAQKWAEIIDLWPSQNFAMPSGDAKFWFDEAHVYCATNVSGTGESSTWTLIDQVTGVAPPDDALDLTKYWGGPVVEGFYNVSSYSSGTLILGSKAFDVPSNWVSKSDVGAIDLGDGPKTDADSCFGSLRWSDFPSLLGRVAVTTSGVGTSFAFANAQPAFGMAASTHQEQVDLYDASMTVVATNITATRVDDSHFTIASGQPTAIWVQIHGSTKWYMNDTSPKGDFVKLDWTSDFRSLGEYSRLDGIVDCSSVQVSRPSENAGGGPIDAGTQFAAFNQTQGCLPFVSCDPKVVCISPNEESFPNGITYEFPEIFTMDEQYGSKWWGYAQPIMTDLFWQQPHRPCNIETCAGWAMDNGSCLDNEVGECPPTEDTPAPKYYFAHPPQVEARLTVPSNYGAAQNESAPALPSGIQIGWLSPVTETTGDVALPPLPPGVSSDGIPEGANVTWELHRAMCEASVGGCRFNYQLPGC